MSGIREGNVWTTKLIILKQTVRGRKIADFYAGVMSLRKDTNLSALRLRMRSVNWQHSATAPGVSGRMTRMSFVECWGLMTLGGLKNTVEPGDLEVETAVVKSERYK
jgi:hypothetical protein